MSPDSSYKKRVYSSWTTEEIYSFRLFNKQNIWEKPTDSKMSQYWEHKIKVLSEWLGSLKIIEDASERTTEYTDNILVASGNIQSKQVELPKSIVLDPE